MSQGGRRIPQVVGGRTPQSSCLPGPCALSIPGGVLPGGRLEAVILTPKFRQRWWRKIPCDLPQHPKSYSKVPGTVKNMTSHSSCIPCSALFLLLLLLLPPTFKGGSLRYHGPGWKLFHRLNKGFRSPHQRQIQQMRQNVPQGQSGNDCQGIFDLYLILDK